MLVLNDGKPLEAYVILSAFLVSEGADISSLRGADLSSLDILKGADINPFNILGHTPSLICPPEVMQLLQRVSSQFRYVHTCHLMDTLLRKYSIFAVLLHHFVEVILASLPCPAIKVLLLRLSMSLLHCHLFHQPSVPYRLVPTATLFILCPS